MAKRKTRIYKSTLELIGGTPLLEVTNIEKDEKLERAAQAGLRDH